MNDDNGNRIEARTCQRITTYQYDNRNQLILVESPEVTYPDLPTNVIPAGDAGRAPRSVQPSSMATTRSAICL
jgi:hypothetical protein